MPGLTFTPDIMVSLKQFSFLIQTQIINFNMIRYETIASFETYLTLSTYLTIPSWRKFR
ncbi:hypothetical protein BTN50_1159 [Candidatus Enterovibrio altilux]|uniref:Uncharacterized protein n=1 Tax=Candidatus Enterovibrio altilux TaxID=1927128 RepID=A0A291B9G9_9GAMM|nr:hypothetical protein BTN50_1159 [Candidatus Enterovibrio luxaltus]